MARPPRMIPILGLSQTDIAFRTGFNCSEVYRYLVSGERRPSLDAARKLATALGWTLDQLYDYLETVRPLGRSRYEPGMIA